CAKSPVAPTLAIVNAALPPLVTVTVCGVLVVCTDCEPKVRLFADSDADAVPDPGFVTGGDVVFPPQATKAPRSAIGAHAATRRRLGTHDHTSNGIRNGEAARARRATDGKADAPVRAVVEIVSVDCADPAPGETVGGLNEQLAPVGRFEQPSVTALANA